VLSMCETHSTSLRPAPRSSPVAMDFNAFSYALSEP
jgi:hypothetical protein